LNDWNKGRGGFVRVVGGLGIIVRHIPRTTRHCTQDNQPGLLPVEGRQVKGLLRGRSTSSCFEYNRGGVRGRDRRRRGRKMREGHGSALKEHMEILTWV
jgi:hypothetical protein